MLINPFSLLFVRQNFSPPFPVQDQPTPSCFSQETEASPLQPFPLLHCTTTEAHFSFSTHRSCPEQHKHRMFPVFINTNLDTHLATIVTAQETVAEFKSQLMNEHPQCFPELGQINIHAMKVRRKSCLYHLSDAMLVSSAFLGIKGAWFVHVDASTITGPQLAELGAKLENSHLPSFTTGASNLPDGLTTQNQAGQANVHLENNYLQPNSSGVLVNNLHHKSCDPPANVECATGHASLAQGESIMDGNPTFLSHEQDTVVSKVFELAAKDLNSELDASLYIDKGLNHEKAKNSDLVNSRNEVLEVNNQSKNDANGLTGYRESSMRDEGARNNNDPDISQLTDSYKFEKRSGDLLLEENSEGKFQSDRKKRRKKKKKDITSETVEETSIGVMVDAAFTEREKIVEADEVGKLSTLNASQERERPTEILPVFEEPDVGATNASGTNEIKVEDEVNEGFPKAMLSEDKLLKNSKKRPASRRNPPSLHKSESDSGNATTKLSEKALLSDDQGAEIKEREIDTMTVKENELMMSEATDFQGEGIMLQKAAEATNAVGTKGLRRKKCKTVASEDHASYSEIVYADGKVEGLKSNFRGPDNHGRNPGSAKLGGQNAPSHSKKTGTSKTSQTDNLDGIGVLLPRSEDAYDPKVDKGKKKSKKTKSNANFVSEPSFDLKDVSQNILVGQNLDVYRVDENKVEENLTERLGECVILPRKKKMKSSKIISNNQLEASLVVGKDIDLKNSQDNDNNHGINSIYLHKANDSRDAVNNGLGIGEAHDRASEQASKSNEDPSLLLEEPVDGGLDRVKNQELSSNDENDRSARHNSNKTSANPADGVQSLREPQHTNSLAFLNRSQATSDTDLGSINSSSIHASAAHDTSKANSKIPRKKKNVSESALSVSAGRQDETLHIRKLGTKFPTQSNQCYVASNKDPKQKLCEAIQNSVEEKSFSAVGDSILKKSTADSYKDEENDSYATPSSPNPSVSEHLVAEKRILSEMPTSMRDENMKSPGSGKARKVARGKKDEENGNGSIIAPQSDNMGGKKSSSIGVLLRKSSSYRKAKIVASQLRFQESEGEAIDTVPDSQAAQDYPELEVQLSQ